MSTQSQSLFPEFDHQTCEIHPNGEVGSYASAQGAVMESVHSSRMLKHIGMVGNRSSAFWSRLTSAPNVFDTN